MVLISSFRLCLGKSGLLGDMKTAWVTLCSARSMFVAQVPLPSSPYPYYSTL